MENLKNKSPEEQIAVLNSRIKHLESAITHMNKLYTMRNEDIAKEVVKQYKPMGLSMVTVAEIQAEGIENMVSNMKELIDDEGRLFDYEILDYAYILRNKSN